jgi:hypothetical protein
LLTAEVANVLAEVAAAINAINLKRSTIKIAAIMI